jgi:hypothetical protein
MVMDGVGDRRLSRGQRQSADAAFHRGHALLEDILRRVHDPRVDVAGHLEVEQVGAVLRAVEGIGGRLVDRYGDCLGRRFGAVAGVDGEGFEFHAESPWKVGALPEEGRILAFRNVGVDGPGR